MNDEGYPLEYFVAHSFLRHGFQISQGDYTHDGISERREVDVAAYRTRKAGGGFVRLYNIVECKWTRDKPWVVMTSPTHRMTSSAIIAQALASRGGNAAMWVNSGNTALKGLKLFESPSPAGFGGRQSLSKGQDKFYDSLRSVTSVSIATANQYNPQILFEFPEACTVVFPMVVIDGDLFEARYDPEADKLDVEPVAHSRCHWRGSDHSPFWTTVDIVTKEGLEDFVAQRRSDFDVVMAAVCESFEQMREGYDQKDVSRVKVHDAPTGTGLPPFWQDMLRRGEAL